MTFKSYLKGDGRHEAEYGGLWKLRSLLPYSHKMRFVFRGWCFCESSVSNLVKDFQYVDLAKFDESVKDRHSRVSACEDLSTKTFTPKADRRRWLREGV